MSIRLVEVRYPFAEFKKGFTFEYDPEVPNVAVESHIAEGYFAYAEDLATPVVEPVEETKVTKK